MLLDIVILAIALFILAKASSVTINSAVTLSRLSGISEAAVGFMLIAVSTSVPEMAIAVIASYQGENTLSLGNLVGSSVTNLTLIFAIIAFYGVTFKLKGIVEIDKAIIISTIV